MPFSILHPAPIAERPKTFVRLPLRFSHAKRSFQRPLSFFVWQGAPHTLAGCYPASGAAWEVRPPAPDRWSGIDRATYKTGPIFPPRPQGGKEIRMEMKNMEDQTRKEALPRPIFIITYFIGKSNHKNCGFCAKRKVFVQ